MIRILSGLLAVVSVVATVFFFMWRLDANQLSYVKTERDSLKLGVEQLQKSIKSMESACQSEDKNTSELILETNSITDNAQDIKQEIAAIPSTPKTTPKKSSVSLQTTEQNNEKANVVDIDGVLDPALTSLLNKAYDNTK